MNQVHLIYHGKISHFGSFRDAVSCFAFHLLFKRAVNIVESEIVSELKKSFS